MSGPEDTYAEQPALEWLHDEGWTVLHGSIIAPDSPTAERTAWSDVVLVDRLRGAVAELNPKLTSTAVEQVVAEVRRTASPDVIQDHEAFHELLVNGVPVAFTDAAGVERSTRARLVDFNDPLQNDLLAINQFRVIVGRKNRKPDILLFVNGLPLGQIELKNPADETATAEAAVNQVAHYRETIPGLYRFVEIIGVSDLVQARLGTITTSAEHFAEWKSMAADVDATKPGLEVMIRGAFAPAIFLDLVENFVTFDHLGGKTIKVLAKYHQVHAVNRAIAETFRAMTGDHRAGVVWHTQGAGKSYTMVFYVGKMRKDARFQNPTVVALTDRNDLDNQLYQTFLRQSMLADGCQRAEHIETGPHNLHDLLRVPAGGIVFTDIQKFAVPRGQTGMPVLSRRTNLVVMADEAHRSQYDRFARNVTRALPEATRIGFTGTPIERGDRSTAATFGPYISIYRARRAVEDHATVPIYYDSRAIPLEVADPALLDSVVQVLDDESEEAQRKLTTAWAKLERVAGAPPRLKKVADDIERHFQRRVDLLVGKGMYVGMSRRICVEVTDLLKARLGGNAVTCVISATATDPPEISRYRRSADEMRQVEKDFKNPDYPLRFVVVSNMWLVGFDVPSLHTLYIDRPMKDHGLLQAMARVNRVFRDKPGGLVVDYIGIGEDLRAALPAYASEDVDDVALPLSELLAKLQEKREVLDEFFHGINYPGRRSLKPAAQAQLFHAALARVLADDETTSRFLDEQLAFARLFALLSTQSEAVAMEGDAIFFADVATTIRKHAKPQDQASPLAEQAVRQFFSQGLGAGEVVDVLELAGQARPEVSVLSDAFLDDITHKVQQPELQIALLRKLLNDEMRSRGYQNSLQAKKFAEELRATLLRYQRRQLTSAEVMTTLIELAKRIRDARRRHEELGLTMEEAAFYDALAGVAVDGAKKADPAVLALARELVKNIRADLTVDWTSRESAEAAIRVKIKRIIRRANYQPPPELEQGGGGIDRVCSMVLEQARELYRYWPDVDDVLFGA